MLAICVLVAHTTRIPGSSPRMTEVFKKEKTKHRRHPGTEFEKQLIIVFQRTGVQEIITLSLGNFWNGDDGSVEEYYSEIPFFNFHRPYSRRHGNDKGLSI